MLHGSSEADTREEIYGRLNGVLKGLDKIERDSEWPSVMQELNDTLNRLKENLNQFEVKNGDDILNSCHSRVKEVIDKKDIGMARDLNTEITQINFKIIDEGYGVALEIGLIKGFEDDFESHEWSNRSQARQLINEAKTIISSNRATKQTLGPIVSQLYSLLPRPDQPISGPGGKVLER